jgi:phenylalanine-4-hydroxylase
MDHCLSFFGWGAVCVDGFIPPRAFQEFQALEILTIAAEIRTSDHLAYTPAPDIIHESAGHAPILVDPYYRHLLKRFGEIGGKAFSSQADVAVYEAIFHLSEVKERPDATPEDVTLAQVRLDAALEANTVVTEAAKMSRLHWWTVEYGLIGTPQRYQLYGAGLLSSVGESVFCHEARVEKRPLGLDCLEVPYDITRQQPQLFVTPSFEALNGLLSEIEPTLSAFKGGSTALGAAIASGELCSVVFTNHTGVIGSLDQTSTSDYLRFVGPCALFYRQSILAGQGCERHPHGFGCPVGRLDSGAELARWTMADLEQRQWRIGAAVKLSFESGVKLAGTLQACALNGDGRLLVLTFRECRVWRGEQLLFDPAWGEYDLLVAQEVATAFPGAIDASYHPEEPAKGKKVPQPKSLSPTLRVLREAYDRLGQLKKGSMGDLQALKSLIDNDLPESWLLRWQFLEQCREQGLDLPLQQQLVAEMKAIEARRFREIPVSSALKMIGWI